jgi:DNA repair photolyase
MVRLPGAVATIFSEWLDLHHPLKKEKVLNRIREAHGGKLNDSEPGRRMRGSGPMAGQVRALFDASTRRLGLPTTTPVVSASSFRRPSGSQLELF